MLLDKLIELAITLFVIDKPMGRLSFLKANILVLVFGILVSPIFLLIILFLNNLGFGDFSDLSEVAKSILNLLGLAIAIVLCSKRLWDIGGEKKLSIAFSFVINLVIPLIAIFFNIFKYLPMIIFILLLVIKGKEKNKIQSEEKKEEISEEG